MPVVTTADLAVFFNEDEFAESAVYKPRESRFDSSTVAVIVDRPQEVQGLAELGVAVPQTILRVRADQVSSPKKGDLFVIAGVTYKVDSPPERGRSALVWKMGVVKQ